MPEWLQQLRPQGHQARYLLTGDIVRYSDSKGTIRLVGRKGTGAKIRGQRIELGEIECHLRQQLPGAKHVIVEVVRPAGSQAILVGFATGLTEDIRASARRAIAELRRVLPSFMIPSAIVPLSKLPTTATGKIHRKALREQMAFLTLSEIRSNNQEERKPYLAPTSSNEALLQEIVEDLLNLPRSSVGLSESFFDAGGDSLTARQLVTKARSRGMTLTVAAIFEDPTLSNLAACMRQLNGVDGIAKDHDPFQTLRSDLLQTVPSFLHESIEDVYPTMGIAARTVTERRIDYFPFAFNGPVDCEQLRKACDALIQAVPVMRSVFIPFQNQHLQVTLRAIKSAYVEHTVPPDESALSWTRAIISEDRKLHHPFDQPVIGFILVRKSIEENILILRLSHAIYDGGCLQQIGKELSAAYNAESLPVATATFTDYSRTAARLRTPEALGFWSEVVAGSEITSLARVSEGQQDSSVFSAEISPSSPPPGITMATAIKAAWAWVLHTETKKLDILFGQICSTRGISLPTGSGSDVIGCCLNTTPVRVRLDTLKISGGTVHDLLNMIQRQHVQGLPYETADWSDVVAHGTAWRKGTDFDSVILHENFGDLPFLRFGDAVGQMGEPVFDSIPADQHLLTTWPVEERLSAMFITRAGLLGSKNAERLVALFGQTLTRFLDFPEEFLFSSANKIHECIGVTSVMVQES
ncbi:hypothetical protein BJY00DRAFT_295577 [Aspergillus carlsbadensis]|nr:hypothetical protein BJY00DRAFT_295577 [Aspergillus carlsbadensis]